MPTLSEVITDNSWGHLVGSEVTVEAAEDHWIENNSLRIIALCIVTAMLGGVDKCNVLSSPRLKHN